MYLHNSFLNVLFFKDRLFKGANWRMCVFLLESENNSLFHGKKKSEYIYKWYKYESDAWKTAFRKTLVKQRSGDR